MNVDVILRFQDEQAWSARHGILLMSQTWLKNLARPITCTYLY